jgi:methylglutaconyl-CoA hydratase
MTTLVHRAARAGFDVLVLDSPANRNALSLQLLEELLAGVRDSAAGSSRGLVLQHTGPSFCSGIDLKERGASARDDQSHSLLFADLLRQLWGYPKPAVAAVDGAVRGGGMGILACADVVVASATSSFGYAEARVGVAPALVMAVTTQVRSSRAVMPHLLSGDTFDAASAEALGLVNEVVRNGLEAALDRIVADLRSGAPGAQRTIKRLGRQWEHHDMDALLDEMTTLSAELFAGEEAREGMAAFAGRREPSWRAGGAPA